LLRHPLEFINLARRNFWSGFLNRFRLGIKLSPRQLACLLGLIFKIGKPLNSLISEIFRSHELNTSPIRSSGPVESVRHLKAFLS
jgi:hypothetical protein